MKVHPNDCLHLLRATCLLSPTMGSSCWYQGMEHHRILLSTHKCLPCVFRKLPSHGDKFSLFLPRKMVLRWNLYGFSKDGFSGSGDQSLLATASAVVHPVSTLLVLCYCSLDMCSLKKQYPLPLVKMKGQESKAEGFLACPREWKPVPEFGWLVVLPIIHVGEDLVLVTGSGYENGEKEVNQRDILEGEKLLCKDQFSLV